MTLFFSSSFTSQSVNTDALLALRRDPPALERAYREHPAPFAEALAGALDREAGDLVLQAWAARLDAAPPRPAEPARAGWTWAEALPPRRVQTLLAVTAALVLTAGTAAKVPSLLGWADYSLGYGVSRWDAFYLRYLPFCVVAPLGVLFAVRYRPPRPVLWAVGGAAAGLLAVQALRPVGTDAAGLAALHLPPLLLLVGGGAALGARWRDAEARTGYLQLLGETAALAGLLALGGAVLVGLTFVLFEAIGIDVEPAFEWVAVYGALGLLPGGAVLAGLRVGAARIAPLVARVFGPLALAVLAVYLPALVLSGGLADRDALLALNVALVAVLALVVLMAAERPDVRRHWTDAVAAALVAVALAADLAAFASIAGRLLEGGLTPNRLAVVGLNVLVAVHLAGLVGPLVRRALGRGGAAGDRWTAGFLTAYAVWGAVVVLAFPLLF